MNILQNNSENPSKKIIIILSIALGFFVLFSATLFGYVLVERMNSKSSNENNIVALEDNGDFQGYDKRLMHINDEGERKVIVDSIK